MRKKKKREVSYLIVGARHIFFIFEFESQCRRNASLKYLLIFSANSSTVNPILKKQSLKEKKRRNSV